MLKIKNEWKTRVTNFESVWNALVSIFILGKLEGWPDTMYYSIDGDDADIGPSLNNNYFMSLYYMIFIWIGYFFSYSYF